MDMVKACEKHLNVTRKEIQPTSLFGLAAAALWKPRKTLYSCNFLIHNCILCFLAACHLAREQTAFNDDDGRVFLNMAADIEFTLVCNKDLIKKFMVLHILYGESNLSNTYTNHILATNFAFKISFRGTNAIGIEYIQLMRCNELFVQYLAKHLNWFQTAEELTQQKPPLVSVQSLSPRLFIKTEARPPLHSLCWERYDFHTAIRNRDTRTHSGSLGASNSVSNYFSGYVICLSKLWQALMSPASFSLTVAVALLLVCIVLFLWAKFA